MIMTSNAEWAAAFRAGRLNSGDANMVPMLMDLWKYQERIGLGNETTAAAMRLGPEEVARRLAQAPWYDAFPIGMKRFAQTGPQYGPTGESIPAPPPSPTLYPGEPSLRPPGPASEATRWYR